MEKTKRKVESSEYARINFLSVNTADEIILVKTYALLG